MTITTSELALLQYCLKKEIGAVKTASQNTVDRVKKYRLDEYRERLARLDEKIKLQKGV